MRRLPEEHHFLLALQDQRALGAHHDFAVAAEAVAVDRRVGDDDLLVRIGDFALLQVVVLVVAGAGELERAVDVVVDVAVGREDVPAADRRDRERHDLGPLLLAELVLHFVVHRADEDAGRVELMAAQLGHQAAAGAVPQPPADQLLQRRAGVDHLAVRP